MVGMKPYSFSMESVLEWRESIEKTSMEKYAAAQYELKHEIQVLEHLNKENEQIKEKSLSCKNIVEIRHLQLYKQTIDERIEAQIEIVEIKKDELENLRLDLIHAQKDRKIMEKLKEKDFSNYNEESKREDQKNLDEIAVLKFKRIDN